MAELDKFKRRIIRTLARMLIKEKRPEDEVWKELKEETGCDCQQLWLRMRALTLKKMSRLLLAEDRHQNIPAVAQMSLSDWLLFDLVLVHEDIDFTGQELKDKSLDLRPLIDLFTIVQKLEIEGKQGEQLANAWTVATFTYNAVGRQCSPMLLQRRWYHLKKMTRLNFYNFWFSYRGNSKLLPTAKSKHMPDKLQLAIAKRYPHVITKPFIEWSECIEQKLVILPEQFEARIQSTNRTEKVIPDSEPDIVVVEPNVLTIEIGDEDSDTEKHQDLKDTQPSDSNPDNAEKPNLNASIKMEPVDEIDIVEENLPSIAEQLMKRDEQLLETVTRIDEKDDDYVPNGDGEHELDKDDSIKNIESELNLSTDILKKMKTDITSNNVEVTEMETNAIENSNLSEVKIETAIQIDTQSNTELDCEEVNNYALSNTEADPIVMPKITNVFGNVNVSTDLPAEMSSMSKKIEQEKSIKEIDDKVKDINTDHEIPMNVEETVEKKLKDFLAKYNKSKVENEIADDKGQSDTKEAEYATNPFLGGPSQLTFVDDGIMLVDDGIVCIDEDDIQDEQDGITTVKAEPTEEQSTEESETSTFDLKLLMQPVVYTTKLDDMIIFKHEKVYCIRNTSMLDNIIVESKPKSAGTLNNIVIKLENSNEKDNKGEDTLNKNITSDTTIENTMDDNSNERMSSDESSEAEEETVSEKNKVKLSSSILQKPKSRSYNPIQLCKNPDFNTRLKRLTVGFLSSTRNRYLLKMLKPMTIDVSKSFESKLINSTLYLKPTDINDVVNVNNDVSEQATDVLPSAMPVQSLIDNLKMNIQDLISPPSNVNAKPNDDVFPERNRVINLPDIDDIRRMNQRLFTAEITPMRVQGDSERCKPPVQLVSTTSNDRALSTSELSSVTNSISNVHNVVDSCRSDKPKNYNLPRPLSKKNASLIDLSYIRRKKLPDPVPVPASKEIQPPLYRTNSKNKKPTYTYISAYRNKPSFTSVNWLSKPVLVETRKLDDTLLTLDTLNKMLNIMNNQNPDVVNSKRSGDSFQQELELEMRLKQFEDSLALCNEGVAISEDGQGDGTEKDLDIDREKKSNEELTVTDLTVTAPKPKVTIRSSVKDKKRYRKACCWARRRLDNPNRKTRHLCPHICQCCCRAELVAITRRTNPPNLSYSKPTAELPIDTNILKSTLNNKLEDKGNSQKVEISIQCDLYADEQIINDSESEPELVNSTAAEPIKDPDIILVNDSVKDSKEIGRTSLAGEDSLAKKNDSLAVKLNEEASNPNLTTNPYFVIQSNKQPLNSSQSLNRPMIQIKRTTLIQNKSAHKSRAKPDENPVIVVSKERGIVKEKILYLNPQQKIQNKTGCPIFLGKNKILMTDGKLPDDGSIKKVTVIPATPPNMASSKAIPHGVQLVLLPNGKVSYTIDPSVTVSAEQLASLASILETVQQQLPLSLNKPPSTKNDDVINLTEEDTESNTSVCFGTKAVVSAEEQANPISSDSPQTDTIDIDNINSETTPRTEQSDLSTNNGNKNIDDKKIKNPNEVIYLDSEVSANEIVITTDDATSNARSINQESDEQAITDNIPSNNKPRSSLLSDLMEKSGISTEDTTPILNEIPNIQPQVTPLCQNESQNENITITSLETSLDTTTAKTTCPSTPELSSITSFAHLKFACENNGKFFKLDLETGSVTPINVCIKSTDKLKQKKILPKFIDLTDEQDNIEKEEPDNRQFSKSLLKDTFHVSSRAKPLKIFKSFNAPKYFPLTERLKIARETKLSKMLHKDSHGDTQKESIEKASRMETNDLDDSLDSDSLDEYIWKGGQVSCDDSDDEPLAIVAKRMRLNEATTDSPSDLQNQNSAGHDAHITAENSSDPSLAEPTNVTNLGLPDALCFMNNPDSDGGEEDCILGV